MTRSYLWQENRRAHIEAMLDSFPQKESIEVMWKGWHIHKDFCSDVNDEIICSVHCSVAAAFGLRWIVTCFRRLRFVSTLTRQICEIKIGSSISGRSTRCMPTFSWQNGKCGQTEATAACYEHQWLHWQHIVFPVSGQPTCRSEN